VLVLNDKVRSGENEFLCRTEFARASFVRAAHDSQMSFQTALGADPQIKSRGSNIMVADSGRGGMSGDKGPDATGWMLGKLFALISGMRCAEPERLSRFSISIECSFV
jgi:hypothetical protein